MKQDHNSLEIARAMKVLRIEGLRHCKYAILVGVCLVLCFMLFASLSRQYSHEAIFLRIAMLFVLGISYALVFFFPRDVLRLYVPFVSISFGLFLLLLVVLIFWPAIGSVGVGFDVMPVGMFCLLVLYGFLRLPIYFALVIGFLFSFALTFAIEETPGGGGFERLILYLAATNFVGLILSKAQQGRELELILLRKKMRNALRDLRDQVDFSEAATRDKARLISSINHEIRQPLMACDVSISRMLAGLPEEQDRELSRKFRQLRVSFDLTRNMLEQLVRVAQLSYCDAIGCSEIRFGRVVEDLAAVFAGDLESGRVSFVSSEIGDLEEALIFSDAVAVGRVLMNFIVNGMRATRGKGAAGGLVRVKFCRRGAWVLVHVVDVGVGIPREDLGSIWNLGFVGDGALEGTGQGLFLVRELVEELPGHHVVMRSKEGWGSRATLVIPVAKVGTHGVESDAGLVAPTPRGLVGVVSSRYEFVLNILVLLDILCCDIVVFSSPEHLFFEAARSDRIIDVVIIDQFVSSYPSYLDLGRRVTEIVGKPEGALWVANSCDGGKSAFFSTDSERCSGGRPLLELPRVVLSSIEANFLKEQSIAA